MFEQVVKIKMFIIIKYTDAEWAITIWGSMKKPNKINRKLLSWMLIVQMIFRI